MWSTQRRHLSCTQDPPGVQLYTETGRLTKGGVSLAVSTLTSSSQPVPGISKLLATPARQSRTNSELSSLPDTRRGSDGEEHLLSWEGESPELSSWTDLRPCKLGQC